jgi:hypothetical protein
MDTINQNDLPRPELRNKTRWASTYNMLKKYLKLEPSIRGIIRNDQRILELQPNAIETTNIEELVKSLEVVNTISLKLQAESVDVNLAYVRDLFDGLIELFDDFKAVTRCSTCCIERF